MATKLQRSKGAWLNGVPSSRPWAKPAATNRPVSRWKERHRAYRPAIMRSRRIPGTLRMASNGRCRTAGTSERHRGKMAHPARMNRPATPATASGTPRPDLRGLAESRKCGTSRIIALSATRRCQIAAWSIPSNHVSTQGSVLISTSPIDSSSTASAPRNCPT